jgi:N-acetylglucosaminyl-diphospho-decaprenol L-rhamnosyltransferase
VDVDVVIVNWNGEDELIRAVRSALAFGGHAIVVDNASTSGSFRDVAAMPGVTALKLRQNRGFSAGCNAGVRAGTGEVILFLNSDAVIVSGTASQLGAAFTDPTPRYVGVALEDRHGVPRRSWRAAPKATELARYILGLDRLVYRRQPLQAPVTDLQQEYRSGYIVGAAFAVRRRDWLALDGMDEKFFLWNEEVDLCQRLLAAGGVLAYCADVRVAHIGGVSWNRLGRVRRQRLRTASSRHYARLHLGLSGWALIAAATPLALVLGAALDVVRRFRPAVSPEQRPPTD